VARTRADERLRRLLALVPWVAAADGPTLGEVCTRFDCTEAELLADLELLFMCGLYPYTPDVLIEVDISDGRVWIRYADYFRRPLRLTPAEGLGLVGAGAALLSVPGADRDGPLARALAKLGAVLGVGGDETLDVDLGAARADVLDLLGQATAGHRQVEIDYYSFGRDGRASRVVEPWEVFSAGGQWYLCGHCHRAGGRRLFRVDRIAGATLLDTTFVPPAGELGGRSGTWSPRPGDPLVVLDLAPGVRWVVDQYPNEGVEDLGGGRLRVRLRVSGAAWLERLLLRLGPDATVVEGPEDAGREAAGRLLARYRGH